MPSINTFDYSVEIVGALVKKYSKKSSSDNPVAILDVRNPNVDFVGGHIPNCINIEYDKFEALIKKEIMLHLCDKTQIVIHCMESLHRGPRCCNKYNQVKKDIMKSKDCDDALKNKLSKQTVYLMDGGFQAYLNFWIVNQGQANMQPFVADFDASCWDKNNGEKIWKHKKYVNPDLGKKIKLDFSMLQ